MYKSVSKIENDKQTSVNRGLMKIIAWVESFQMWRYFRKRLQSVTAKLKCRRRTKVQILNPSRRRRLKIFQAVQKNLSYLGISHYYSIQKRSINWRNMSVLVVLCTSTAMCFVYLCCEATTFEEYTTSVYTCLI